MKIGGIPVKPTAPRAEHEHCETVVVYRYEELSLAEILAKLPSHVKYEDIWVEFPTYCEAQNNEVYLAWKVRTPNKSFEKEMVKYERAVKQYERDLAIYEERMRTVKPTLDKIKKLEAEIEAEIKKLKKDVG